MRSALADVVHLGGLALQSEDCAIRAAVHHRGEHGGLARVENERLHQFLIWRAVLPIWHAEIEKESRSDLVLVRDGIKHHFELKNWRREPFPRIQDDIDRKLSRHDRGYALVTSCDPVKQTEKNITDLSESLSGIHASMQERFVFRTVNGDGAEYNFWIVGWPTIRRSADTAV